MQKYSSRSINPNYTTIHSIISLVTVHIQCTAALHVPDICERSITDTLSLSISPERMSTLLLIEYNMPPRWQTKGSVAPKCYRYFQECKTSVSAPVPNASCRQWKDRTFHLIVVIMWGLINLWTITLFFTRFTHRICISVMSARPQ